MNSVGSEEIVRNRLLGRLRVIQPRLALFVAPAGFGKSSLAHQFAGGFSTRAHFDSFDGGGERELCRRFIAARTAAPVPVSADVDTALTAWSAHSEPAAFIFENIERWSDRSSLRKLFELFLTRTPEGCTLVVCSRKPLPLRISKIAPPHRIVSFRAADLAFDRTEIEELFAPLGVSPQAVVEIERVTRGWPIGVLALRRLALEGRLEKALSRLDDVAFEELRAYLIDEVFAMLSALERSALIACASIRGACADDIAAALEIDDAQEVMNNLLEVSPFLSRGSDGAYEIHPLLQAAIAYRYRHRCSRSALKTARAYEERRSYVRAAQIYHGLGDVDAAVRVLIAENKLPERRRSRAYSTLVASLDDDTLRRYPIARGLATCARRFRVDAHQLRDETAAVWSGIPANADFELRCNIGNPLARVMYETGRFDAAEALLRSLEAEAGGIPAVPRSAGEAYIARTLGSICARTGRLDEADRYFRKGYFAIAGSEHVEGGYSIERALVERLYGRRDDERRLADAAIEAAFAAEMPVQTVCALAEAAFGSWFAGEDERFIGYVRRLTDRIAIDGMRGMAHFCAAADPEDRTSPNGTEQPNWLACAHLVSAANSSGTERLDAALAAKAAADLSGDVFLRVVANVALGLAAPARRTELLTEALIAASLIEADPPQAGVSALIAGEPAGFFAPLVARFVHGAAGTADTIEIDVAAREVRRGQTIVPLPERERAVLLALARQRRTYSRHELMPLLWPDLSEESAREALNSCLYRLRGRLGEDVVKHERDGYRLREDVRVDLREIEKCMSAIVPRSSLTAQEVNLLLSFYRRVRAVQRPEGDAWHWFQPVATQIDDMRRALGMRVAKEALGTGRFERALEIGRELVCDDPCDEAARRLVMRCHLGLGDQASAMRELRSYRSILRRELDVEPSPSLLELVRA